MEARRYKCEETKGKRKKERQVNLVKLLLLDLKKRVIKLEEEEEEEEEEEDVSIFLKSQ